MGVFISLEQVTGLEPVISAWKANVLPLHYTRMIFCFWCGRRDLNSYACAALEPKSSASANSATPACCLIGQNGDPSGIRTPDTLIKSQVLYRLS